MSALTFPQMLEWLGHHDRDMWIPGLEVRSWLMVWRKVTVHENCWPAEGLWLRLTVSADEQSEKIWMLLISGQWLEARVAAIERAANSVELLTTTLYLKVY
jgi:hypothetical protein